MKGLLDFADQTSRHTSLRDDTVVETATRRIAIERRRQDTVGGRVMRDNELFIPIDPDHTRGDRARPGVLAVIALGGMIGATARFELSEAIPTKAGHFPWATFWTNLSGSFVLGFLLIILLERFPPTRYLRPFLATGILGAYTTMSTFAVETAVLVKDGYVATGLLYGVGSFSAGLLLAYVGIAAARLTPHRRTGAGPGKVRP